MLIIINIIILLMPIYFQPHIMPRINKRILDAPLHMPRYLTIPDHGPCPSKIISDYHHLPLAKHIKCMMGRIRYLSRSGFYQIQYIFRKPVGKVE